MRRISASGAGQAAAAAAKPVLELSGLHGGGAVTSVCFGSPLPAAATTTAAAATAAAGGGSWWANVLLTAGRDRGGLISLCLIDIRTQRALAPLRTPLSAPASFRGPRVEAGQGRAWQPRAALSAGCAFALAGGGDGRLTVWDVRQAHAPAEAPAALTLRGHTAAVTAVAWRPGWHPVSASGAALASADKDGTVLLWERERRDGRSQQA
jgi:WD40 repeat protein